jgi:hypothetical protein
MCVPALYQSRANGYLLSDFYSGPATGKSGRFTEGLLLRRPDQGLAFYCARRWQYNTLT